MLEQDPSRQHYLEDWQSWRKLSRDARICSVTIWRRFRPVTRTELQELFADNQTQLHAGMSDLHSTRRVLISYNQIHDEYYFRLSNELKTFIDISSELLRSYRSDFDATRPPYSTPFNDENLPRSMREYLYSREINELL